MSYAKNKAQYIKRAKDFAVANPELVRSYKQKHKVLQRKKLRDFVASLKSTCKYCTETKKECLEFHHTGKKSYLINRMIQEGYSLESIKKEIKQCEIICANCHRKKHATGTIYNNAKAKYVIAFKKQNPCQCGESFWACLDFHHLPEHTKILNIGAMIRDTFYKLDDIKQEIAKCKILCVNCHRTEHLSI